MNRSETYTAPPVVSVIIVAYESGAFLLRCLKSLQKQGVPLQTIVVDNGHSDNSVETATKFFPSVEVIRPPANVGFAEGVNLGVSRARAEYVLILNPDVRLDTSCISKLLGEFERPNVGVVGPRIRLTRSGAVEWGSTIDPLGYPISFQSPLPPLFVSGCALATRTASFRRLGGFDGRFFMFMEDVDFCWRVLLSGQDVAVADKATAYHAGGASTPGGYPDRDPYTTTFRVHLKERNTLAMLLKCYALPTAVVAIPLYIALSLGTAIFLALMGQRAGAIAVARGLAWNARQLGRTLEMRREIQKIRVIPDRLIRSRMYRGLLKFELLRRHGSPRVIEGIGPPEVIQNL